MPEPEPNPIERGFFRETEDGTTIFFPWGLGYRGYRLPDEPARKRAARGPSLLLGATIVIATWAAHALQRLLASDAFGLVEALAVLAGPSVALLVVFVGYALWASRFVEGCPASDLQIPREDRLREAAELVQPRKLALIGAVTCGLGALVAWLDARVWWLGLLTVGIGIGMIFWSSRLERAASR